MERAKKQKPLWMLRAPDENRSLTNERIGQELKKYYKSCTTEELPPRLLALLKKLDEETPESGDHVEVIVETKD
jgi:hypothetical protein